MSTVMPGSLDLTTHRWPGAGVAARRLAVAAITGYQRYLSPRKGFRCAHRILYGEESCSQYIKRVVAESGLWLARQAARERFRRCREASAILRATPVSARPEPAQASSSRRSRGGGDETDDLCLWAGTEMACLSLDCLPDLACGALDCGACGL